MCIFSNSYVLYSRVGGTSSVSTTWTSDSQCVSKVAQGLEFGKAVVVTSAPSKIATSSRAISFDTHTLIAFGRKGEEMYNGKVLSIDSSGANGPTTGSALLILKGINFGVSDRTLQQIRLAGSASEWTSWISNSAVSCNAMSGIGAGYRCCGDSIVVTGSRFPVSWTDVFSFDLPSISTLLITNSPVSGSVLSTISGQNFGLGTDHTSRARFVNSAAMATFWRSDSSVRSKIPRGKLDLAASQVTAGKDARGSLTISWSYDGGWTKLTCLRPANSVLGGSVERKSTLTMFGFKFSYNAFTISARVGKTACEMTAWLNDVTTYCVVPIGGFNEKGLDTVVTVNLGEYYINTLSASFSFDDPSVNLLSPSNTWHTSKNRASLRILGSAFGSVSYTFGSRIHYTTCEASVWQADTIVYCQVAAGYGGTMHGILTVGSQGYVLEQYPLIPAGWHRSIGSISQVISFDLPKLALSTAGLNVMRGGGGSKFLLFGGQFGLYMSSMSTSVGLSNCEATFWKSESSMQALPAVSVGGTHTLAITSGLQVGSTGLIFSFDKPFPYLYTPLALTDDVCFESFCGKNFTKLAVTGNNYGFDQSSVKTRMAFSDCAETSWVSVSSLTCKLASGSALVQTIAVSVHGQVGTDFTAFTYFRHILSMESPNGKVTGGLSITLDGKFLGDVDYTPLLRMGDTACDVTEWVSSVQVRCKVPSSIFRPERIVLTLGPYCPPEFRSACEELWVPIVLLTINAPTVGAASLTINGLGFQTSDPTGHIFIGGTPCEASEWVSDVEVKCKVSAGSGRKRDLLVDINNQLVTLEQAFGYDDPVPSDIRRANGPAGVNCLNLVLTGLL